MDSKYVKAYVSMLNQLTEEEGVSRFANTADFYDNGKTGPEGQRTTIDTSTGKQTTSSGSGIDVTSVQGTPISHTRPSFDGATSVKTYTGSAQGKGVASGGQKLRYNDGALDATQYQDPAGKQTSARMAMDLGLAKATVDQQGDENAPIQTSMKYVQPDGSYADNRPDQVQTMEEESELEEIRRLAFGKKELDEAEPSNFQQAKTAVGQQYNNYKEAGAMADAAAKAGHISAADAQAAKSHLAGAMVGGGIDATKAAMRGDNPEQAYQGSMVKSIGDTVAQSGITPQVAQQAAATAQQYRGPNAQDITKDPAFAKLPKARQQQVMQAQQQIRNMSDDDLAAVKNFDAKKAGADLRATGQGIANSQKTVKTQMANNDPNAEDGLASPSTYAALGMERPDPASVKAGLRNDADKQADELAAPAPAAPTPAATTPPVPNPANATSREPTAPPVPNPANATPRAPTATTSPSGPATPEQPVQEGDDDLSAMRRIMNHRR
jgi:hypothetical protein